MDDFEAYDAFPEDRHWYDKLYVANTFGYHAGTDPIPVSGRYIVRPVVNLEGGSLSATIGWYEQGTVLAPDLFWCEVFTGRHITIDYTRFCGQWVQWRSAFEGVNTPDNLIEFTHWTRVDYPFELPVIMNEIESNRINIELIDNRIIEVHLRHNPDPIQYDHFIPIWSISQLPPDSTWVRISAVDHIAGRLGFYVQQK